MPLAMKHTKPEPHTCCPNAARHLKTYRFSHSWHWKVTGDIPVIFCPWCAEELPKARTFKLTAVR